LFVILLTGQLQLFFWMQFRTSLSNPLQGFFLRRQFSKWSTG